MFFIVNIDFLGEIKNGVILKSLLYNANIYIYIYI